MTKKLENCNRDLDKSTGKKGYMKFFCTVEEIRMDFFKDPDCKKQVDKSDREPLRYKWGDCIKNQNKDNYVIIKSATALKAAITTTALAFVAS